MTLLTTRDFCGTAASFRAIKTPVFPVPRGGALSSADTDVGQLTGNG